MGVGGGHREPKCKLQVRRLWRLGTGRPRELPTRRGWRVIFAGSGTAGDSRLTVALSDANLPRHLPPPASTCLHLPPPQAIAAPPPGEERACAS